MLVLFLLFPCPANREACQESGPSFILTNSVVSGTQGKKKNLIITFLFVDDYSDFFYCTEFIHLSSLPRYFPSVGVRILFNHFNYLVSGAQEIFLYFPFQFDVW